MFRRCVRGNARQVRRHRARSTITFDHAWSHITPRCIVAHVSSRKISRELSSRGCKSIQAARANMARNQGRAPRGERTHEFGDRRVRLLRNTGLRLKREHGVSVSHPVMWETLGRLGLTLKKAHPCVRAGSPGHRRSLVAPVPYRHWHTTTFLCGVRHDGLVAPLVLDGAINGAAFLAYIEQMLCPTLQPGDIVIRDNLPPRVAGRARCWCTGSATSNCRTATAIHNTTGTWSSCRSVFGLVLISHVFSTRHLRRGSPSSSVSSFRRSRDSIPSVDPLVPDTGRAPEDASNSATLYH